MIKSTLLKNYAIIVALFDHSSMHTFIAKTFVGRIGLSVEDLSYDLVVSTLVGASLTTGVCVRGVNVVIHQHIMLMDFIVLPMKEFDTIFGMD